MKGAIVPIPTKPVLVKRSFSVPLVANVKFPLVPPLEESTLILAISLVLLIKEILPTV